MNIRVDDLAEELGRSLAARSVVVGNKARVLQLPSRKLPVGLGRSRGGHPQLRARGPHSQRGAAGEDR